MDVEHATRRVLAEAYAVPGAVLHRISAGLATRNFKAVTPSGQRLFVKVYRPDADLAAERAAIEVTQFAGSGGVPAARLIPDAGGSVIHVSSQLSLSVWSFVDGEPGDTVALTAARMQAVGDALGRLHRRLTELAVPDTRPAHWCDLRRAQTAIEVMIERVQRAAHLDAVTRAWAVQVLRWRLDHLPQVAATLSRLPAPAMQVVHGDVSAGNIVFRGAQVAAFVDFHPPAVRPAWWEIGRIGCSQQAVLQDGDWVDRLGRLLVAYHAQQWLVPVGDLAAVLPAARCFMTASVTPFDDLVDPDALQPVDVLAGYGQARQAAVRVLWEQAEERDVALQKMLT